MFSPTSRIQEKAKEVAENSPRNTASLSRRNSSNVNKPITQEETEVLKPTLQRKKSTFADKVEVHKDTPEKSRVELINNLKTQKAKTKKKLKQKRDKLQKVIRYNLKPNYDNEISNFEKRMNTVRSRSPLIGNHSVQNKGRQLKMANNFKDSMTKQIELQTERLRNEANDDREINSYDDNLSDSVVLPSINHGKNQFSKNQESSKSRQNFPNLGTFAKTNSNFKNSFNMKNNPAMELRQGYQNHTKYGRVKSSRSIIKVSKPKNSKKTKNGTIKSSQTPNIDTKKQSKYGMNLNLSKLSKSHVNLVNTLTKKGDLNNQLHQDNNLTKSHSKINLKPLPKSYSQRKSTHLDLNKLSDGSIIVQKSITARYSSTQNNFFKKGMNFLGSHLSTEQSNFNSKLNTGTNFYNPELTSTNAKYDTQMNGEMIQPNKKYGRFTIGFMKSYGFARKLINNPGCYFNFHKNDQPAENLDNRIRNQFYLNFRDSQLFRKSSFVSELRKLMMKEIQSSNLRMQTFKDMFTEEVDPNSVQANQKKLAQDNIPKLVMRGFHSYISLEDKVQNLVESIEKSRIEIMDQMEIKKYPFISAYMSKKNTEIETDIIISPIEKSYKYKLKQKRLLIEQAATHADVNIPLENPHLQESQDYIKMVNLIKRVCPTMYSSSQATKPELENLITFLDTAFDLENIKKLPEMNDMADFENIEIDVERINQVNSMGAILFTEIMRQVAIDSSARGYILSKIWNFNMNCFTACVHSLQDVLAKISVLFTKDRAELDKAFNQDITAKDKEIAELKRQNAEYKKQIADVTEKMIYEEEASKNFRVKLGKYRSAFKIVKREWDKNKWEKRKIALRIIGIRARLESKTNELYDLRDKYDFVEKRQTEADWHTKQKKKTRQQIEKDLIHETQQIEKLIEEEFNNPHDHDEIKYELGLGLNDEDDFMEDGMDDEGNFDDNLDEVIVGIVGNNGEIIKNYKDRGTQYDLEANAYWHDDQGTQTHISLVNQKYDALFSSNINLDKAFNTTKFGSLHRLGTHGLNQNTINTSIQIENGLANFSALNISGLGLTGNILPNLYTQGNINSIEFKKMMMMNEKFNNDPQTYEDEEFHEIMEYVGLLDGESDEFKNIFTKAELYNYLNGQGGGVFKQLKQYFRIQSMQYFNDQEIEESQDNSRRFKSLDMSQDVEFDGSILDQESNNNPFEKTSSGDSMEQEDMELSDNIKSGGIRRKVLKKSNFSKSNQKESFNIGNQISKNIMSFGANHLDIKLSKQKNTLNTSIHQGGQTSNNADIFGLNNASIIGPIGPLESIDEGSLSKRRNSERFKTAAFKDGSTLREKGTSPRRRISVLNNLPTDTQNKLISNKGMVSFGTAVQQTRLTSTEDNGEESSLIKWNFYEENKSPEPHIEGQESDNNEEKVNTLQEEFSSPHMHPKIIIESDNEDIDGKNDTPESNFKVNGGIQINKLSSKRESLTNELKFVQSGAKMDTLKEEAFNSDSNSVSSEFKNDSLSSINSDIVDKKTKKKEKAMVNTPNKFQHLSKMDKNMKLKLDQLRISMKYNPKETKSKIKQAVQKRGNILKKLKHASKMISMVQTMKKTEKSAKEFKGEIKQLKKIVKGHKQFEETLQSRVENANVKIDQLLQALGCSNYSDYIKLSKKGFNIISKDKLRKFKISGGDGLENESRRGSGLAINLDDVSQLSRNDTTSTISRSVSRSQSKATTPRSRMRRKNKKSKSPRNITGRTLQRQNSNISRMTGISGFTRKPRGSMMGGGSRRMSVMDTKKMINQKLNQKKQKRLQKVQDMVKVVRKKKMSNKGVHYLSQKYTLKMMTQVYKAMLKLDNKTIMTINFPLFVYKFFNKKLGISKRTEKKFYQFLLSIRQYGREGCFRVNLFSKFMTLQEFSNYSEKEVYIYISGLKKINQFNSIGFDIPNNETDSRHLVAFNRGLEYFKSLFEQTEIDQLDLKKMKDRIFKLKQNDPTNMNKIGGAVDIDCFLNTMIEMYLSVIAKTKEYVKYAFASADLDGSNKVTINEFLILFKHLEPKFYNEAELFVMFSKLADTTEKGMQAMSIQRFSEMCFSKGYFSLQRQYEFVGVDPDQAQMEILMQFDQITKNWKHKKKKLLIFFDKNSIVDDIDYWLDSIGYIEEQLKVREQSKYFQVLISYTMVERELEEMRKKREEIRTLQDKLDKGVETDSDDSDENSRSFTGASNRIEQLKNKLDLNLLNLKMGDNNAQNKSKIEEMVSPMKRVQQLKESNIDSSRRGSARSSMTRRSGIVGMISQEMSEFKAKDGHPNEYLVKKQQIQIFKLVILMQKRRG